MRTPTPCTPALSRVAAGQTPNPQHIIRSRLMKISEVAALLGVSPVTIRRRLRDGSLPHLRIKGRLYFKPQDMHAYVETHRGNPLP